jgi:hypothetical protein
MSDDGRSNKRCRIGRSKIGDWLMSFKRLSKDIIRNAGECFYFILILRARRPVSSGEPKNAPITHSFRGSRLNSKRTPWDHQGFAM